MLQVPAAGHECRSGRRRRLHPFLNAGIPVLTIHSLTRETLPILHHASDRVDAVRPDDYYLSYRLAATYLAYLDSVLE
ncbi:MAG: hypothetical protein WDO73_13625 [Ignavibacteriota bacterium]